MIELRFHSRGGQGGVIAGKILAVACSLEGKHVQSFPSFGVERRAAPVMTFVRVDDKPIRIRSQVYSPDILVVMDPSLILFTPVLNGLKHGGMILVNSERPVEHFGFPDKFKACTFNASAVALKHKLGSITQPIVNTAILGALAKASGLVKIESVVEAIKEDFPVRPEDNVAAALDAYNEFKPKASI